MIGLHGYGLASLQHLDMDVGVENQFPVHGIVGGSHCRAAALRKLKVQMLAGGGNLTFLVEDQATGTNLDLVILRLSCGVRLRWATDEDLDHSFGNRAPLRLVIGKLIPANRILMLATGIEEFNPHMVENSLPALPGLLRLLRVNMKQGFSPARLGVVKLVGSKLNIRAQPSGKILQQCSSLPMAEEQKAHHGKEDEQASHQDDVARALDAEEWLHGGPDSDQEIGFRRCCRRVASESPSSDQSSREAGSVSCCSASTRAINWRMFSSI